MVFVQWKSLKYDAVH